MSSGQTSEWSCKQDEILIDFVRTHECLYNIQHKDYRNTQVKQSLWNEIGDILKKTETECCKRWAYVRDYYVRRRGKTSTGTTGEAAKKRSNLLSFLDSMSSAKRSIISSMGDLPRVEDHIKQEPHSEESSSKEFKLLSEDETSQKSSQEETENYILEAPGYKRKYTCFKCTHSEERIKISKQRQKDDQKEDANDLFFASMAKIVTKLPEIQQANLRMQIGNLVGLAEIEFFSNTSQEYRPSSSLSSPSEYTYNQGQDCFPSQND